MSPCALLTQLLGRGYHGLWPPLCAPWVFPRSSPLHVVMLLGYPALPRNQAEDPNSPLFSFWKRFYLFLERREGREKRGRETSVRLSCLSRALHQDLAHNPGVCPDWEPNQQPLWFAGRHSIHWATPASASLIPYCMKAEESTLLSTWGIFYWDFILINYFFRFYLFIFRGRVREGEIEGERNIDWLPLACTPRTHNPGMCPD